MGMSRSLYLGPYIKAKNELVVSSTSIYTCPNTGCRKHKQNLSKENRCCGQCGTELVNLFVEATEKKISHHAVVEKVEEVLCSFMGESTPDKMAHYWVPNVRRPGEPRKSFHLDFDGDTEALEVSNPDMEKEKAWFLEAYAKEIKILEETYGKENLTLCWGALGTYS